MTVLALVAAVLGLGVALGFVIGIAFAARHLPRALAKLSDSERAVFARKVAAARDR